MVNLQNMLFKRQKTSSTNSDSDATEVGKPDLIDDGPIHLLSVRVVAMALIVSLGGFIFGYDTGQISGFLGMKNFVGQFADDGETFTPVREGLITGLLSIGTLVGSLCAGPIADFSGRKYSIIIWNIVFCIGVVVQISTPYGRWLQVALGRLVAGFGVGGLSVLTPMYQSETAPKQIRGALISAYQLFITFGIFIAYCINYGTYTIESAASWRITMGIGFVPSFLMMVGILFLPETPRYQYRKGQVEDAKRTIAKSYGVNQSHSQVVRELAEIKEKFDAENADSKWYEIFTAPKMGYRTILGLVLQSFQQLTGANYFFYYGTTIFAGVNPNIVSFAVSLILGGINFGSTFFGLWVVENIGRRKALIGGAIPMAICFFIFASVGHFDFQPKYVAAGMQASAETKTPGIVMIVFTCIFIFFYAITWGPIVWALVAEIYPSKYRARAIGIATSANWTWNFLIAFFTPFITGDIDFAYGYVFGGCNFAAAIIIYLFVFESNNRTLEEIDTMYCSGVKPWKSSSWNPPLEELEKSGAMQGLAGGDGRYKRSEAMGAGAEQQEHAVAN